MFVKVYLFSCDHPGCNLGSDIPVKFNSIDQARSEGWAISRGRKHVYCPLCAVKHRNTGCLGSEDVSRWRY